MWFYVLVALLLLYIYLSYRPIYPRGLLSHVGTLDSSVITTHITTSKYVPNNPDPQHATHALTPMKSLQFVNTGYGKVHVVLLAPDGGKQQIAIHEINDIISSLVVLVHGFSISMVIWSSVAAALRREGWYVLLMDNYGRGFSDCPEVTHAGGLYVSQINQVLTALNITRPIHFAGVSMGGAIASLYTSTFPSRVASLSLFCAAGLPTPFQSSMGRILSFPVLGELLFRVVAPKKVLTNEATWVYKGTPLYHAYCRFLLHFVSSHPGYLRALFRTLTDFPMTSLAPVYATLGRETSRPTLLVWGDRDTLLPYSMALDIQKSIPHAELVTIHGANHNMLIDHSQPCATAFITFLNKLRQ